jgi:hypothetical protein
MKEKKSYVNNQEFSQAVVDYVREVERAEKLKYNCVPVVPDYIAECFLKIATGLSRKPNFSRYTFKDEMIMDGVENCLRAIRNYDIEAATRTGKPNAFGYFTQIIYYAFLRRIQRENRQQDIKLKYMTSAGVEQYMNISHDSQVEQAAALNFIDSLRSKIDEIKDYDRAIKEFEVEENRRRRLKQIRLADSNLEEFINE